MATDREINRLINLELQIRNVSASKARIRDIRKEIDELAKRFPGLKNDSAALSTAIQGMANAYQSAGQKAEKSLDRQSRGFQNVERNVANLNRSVTSFAKSLAVLFGIGAGGPVAILTQATNRLTGFNKELIDAASKATRFGISFSQVEKMARRVSEQTNLTRQETLKLFQTYESGFRVMSASGFEKIAANIRKVTGPNAESMNAMLQQISGVVQKVPELQSAFENLGEVDKRRIKSNIQLMAITNRISQEELKAVQRYLSGANQVSAADRKKLADTMRQQQTIKQFAQAWERIQLSMGEAFAPLVEKLSDFVNDNAPKIDKFFQDLASTIESIATKAVPYIQGITDEFGKWAKAIAIVIASLTAALALMKTYSVLVAGKGLMMSVGRAAGLGAGAAGSAAGAAGGAIGALRTPATLGGRLLRAGKLAPTAIVAAGLFYGLGEYSDSQREQGNMRAAGAAGAGSAAAGVAGYGLTGAAVGSILPGVGTAFGAAVGTLVGVVMEWGTITESIADLWTGKSKEERELEKQRQETVKLFANATTDFSGGLAGALASINPNTAMGRIAAREQGLEKTRKDEAERAINEVTVAEFTGQRYDLGKVRTDRESTQKNIDSIRNRQEEERANKFFALEYDTIDTKTGDSKKEQIRVGSSQSGIAKAESEAKDIGAQIEVINQRIAAASAEDNGEEVERQQRLRDYARTKQQTLSDAIEKVKQNNELEDLHNESLQNGITALSTMEAKEAQILQVIGRRKDMAEAYGKETQAQLGILDSMVDIAVRLGDIGPGQVANQVKAYNAAIDDQVAALRRVQEGLQAVDSAGDPNAMRDEYRKIVENEAGLSDEQKEEALKRINSATAEEITNRAEIKNITSELNKLEIERRNSVLKVAASMQGVVDAASSQASVFTSLVNLSDNMAIGIGASVAARKQASDALQKQVDLERERLSLLEQALKNDPHNLAVQKEYYDTENRILGLQTQQAGLLKSTRDGWIRAIGAMNTGAGRFTKIMISQEQNMEAGLRNVDGMLTSYTSGSIGKGGFRGSSRFTSSGGVLGEGFAGASGSAGVTARNPYGVSIDSTMGSIDLATGLRNQVEQGIGFMQRNATRASSGGGPVLINNAAQASQLHAGFSPGSGVNSVTTSPRSASPGLGRGMGTTTVEKGTGRSTGEVHVHTTIKYGEWNKLVSTIKKAVSEAEDDTTAFIKQLLSGPKVNPGD